jgi:hypothetical protein
METLAPRAAYGETAPGYWLRFGVLIGLLFGAFKALSDLLGLFGPRTPVPEALSTGAFGAAFFGVTFTLLTRRSARKTLDRIYAGHPRLVEPPPPGREYLYRLPCAMVVGRVAIGGVLYLGPGGAVFQPLRRNLRRHRVPVFLEPLEALRARLVEQAPPRAERPLWNPTPRALELSAGDTTARFVVPHPETTLAVLQSRIAALAAS